MTDDRPGFDFDRIELRLVQDLEDVFDLKEWMGERRPGWLGLDVETTGLNKARDRVRTYQFGDERKGWTVPLDEYRGVVRELLAGYDRPVVYHNAIFDLGFNAVEGLSIRDDLVDDTMLMSHVLQPASAHALKLLATRYVDKRSAHGQSLLKEQMDKHRWGWDTVPLDLPAFWMYSALDTCLTAALAPHLRKRLDTPELWGAYEIEREAVPILARAETRGMAVDPEYLRLASEELTRRLDALAPHLGNLNANSDAQVIAWLQERGYRLVKLTEKGKWSTDDEVLAHAATVIPEAAYIRDARRYRLFRDRYVHKMRDLGEPEPSGLLKVCCNVRPVAAVTSRMSVADPPLQQMPRGRWIRDAFVARPGHKLVSADYDGMEMRVLASLANEEALIQTFERGEDPHGFVAGEVYGPGWTKVQRGTAKNAAFALIYGAGVPQFSRTARISEEAGQAFMDRYAELFPRVARFMEEQISAVRGRVPARGKNGWIELRWGRTIPVPRDEAYKATNYRIQGSCAQVLKRKIVEMDNAGLGEYLRLPVHDQVIMEAPDDEVEFVRHTLNEVMPDRHSFRVTLTATAEVARSWGEMYVSPDFPPLLPAYWPWDAEAAEDARERPEALRPV